MIISCCHQKIQQLQSEMKLTIYWSRQTEYYSLMLGTNWETQYDCQPGNHQHHINKDTKNSKNKAMMKTYKPQ